MTATTKNPPRKKTPANPIKKQTVKHVREVDVSKSDRIQLIEQANAFVGHIVIKQVVPIAMNGTFSQPLEITPAEDATYRSALDFLRRQFDTGARDSEAIDKRLEQEQSIEF